MMRKPVLSLSRPTPSQPAVLLPFVFFQFIVISLSFSFWFRVMTSPFSACGGADQVRDVVVVLAVGGHRSGPRPIPLKSLQRCFIEQQRPADLQRPREAQFL